MKTALPNLEMITTREREISVDYNLDDDKTKKAVSLASELVNQLQDDEYVIKKNEIPTVFVRIDRWTKDLEPSSFDFNGIGIIKLTDNSGIVLTEDDRKFLAGKEKSRLVLLSSHGFTSFIMEQ